MQIKVENLSYVYSVKTPFECKALDNVSFTVNSGETVGIIGSTGSGKSTLGKHFNALIRIQKGKIYVGDYDLTARKIDFKGLRRTVGMLFQYPEYQLFDDTVLKDVSFGPKNFGMSREESEVCAREALALVGMSGADIEEKSPFELSGGQKRRVAVAGVIASKPKVLLLDEPTAGLDPRGKREMLELVSRLKKEFAEIVIMISHNMDEIAEFCDRVIVLDGGKLVANGTPEEIFTSPEIIDGTGLDLPHVYKLRAMLHQNGIDVPCARNAEELAKAIYGRIGK